MHKKTQNKPIILLYYHRTVFIQYTHILFIVLGLRCLKVENKTSVLISLNTLFTSLMKAIVSRRIMDCDKY